MNNMASAIIPKSDQLNADDLLVGPITIKITDVTVRGGQEQPVSIHYEGDDGKPYKSCKSMNRVLVIAWGPDSKKYAGRSLTLYCDPKVKWGGMEVGGIRISHMSDIDSTITMALTATKGNKKPFTVRPMEVERAPEPSPEILAAINACATLDDLGRLWKTTPNKPTYESAKDARKKALATATGHQAFIDEMNSDVKL